ncbi:MAG: hypothetical protein PCFJNLEI_03759 [Verrucomicrobiae bacterium]|nr:hypothetical protein [Verrucomicrobiae bacterium]
MRILLALIVALTACATKSSNNLPPRLGIYGGKNHQVFLGCLVCPDTASDSIWNRMGAKGGIYNSQSIWNWRNPYGDPTSQHSPWNPTATNPPVIFDLHGKRYGRFTINRQHSDFPTDPNIIELINKAEIRKRNRI